VVVAPRVGSTRDCLRRSTLARRGALTIPGGRRGALGADLRVAAATATGIGLRSVDTPRISIGPAGYRINRD